MKEKTTKIKNFCRLGIFSKNPKKAQGLPMQVVVIAVLLLIVLGFLAYLLYAKGIGPFSRGLAECVEKGGKCQDSCTAGEEIKSFSGCYVKEGGKDVYKKDKVCCLQLT